jgi:HEPN domain-containing protein
MQPPDPDARAWTAKAESDLVAACDLLRVHSTSCDVICFLCQQAGEKYLKAVMVALADVPPRTHDLAEVVRLLARRSPDFGQLSQDANALSPFAVELRYPGVGQAVSQAESQQAVAAACRIKAFCLEKLRPHAD